MPNKRPKYPLTEEEILKRRELKTGISEKPSGLGDAIGNILKITIPATFFILLLTGGTGLTIITEIFQTIPFWLIIILVFVFLWLWRKR